MKIRPKKILRIPLRILESVVQNKTGLDLDLSEIFWTNPEGGNASDVALAVSMRDGWSAEIMWDPDGPVSSSQLTAVVLSILKDRKNVDSIQVSIPPTFSPEAVKPSELVTAPTSEQLDLFDPPIRITYSDIEDSDE